MEENRIAEMGGEKISLFLYALVGGKMTMMTPAVLTTIGTIIGALISGAVSLTVSSWQHNKSIALIEYRLSQLEEKVDKHNNVVERLYKVEAQVGSMR